MMHFRTEHNRVVAVDHVMLLRRTTRMHTFVRRLLSITLPLLLAAGTARAGGGYVQTNLVTNNQSLMTAQQTDPNLQGAWGLSFSNTSPFWISDQAANFNGSGAATIYRVSNTSSSDRLHRAAGSGGHEPGERSPEPQHDQWPDGPGEHQRTGDHHGLDGLPCRHFQGRLHFRQSGRLDFGVERGCELDDHGDRRGCLLHRAGDRQPAGAGGAAQIYAADQNSGNIDVINNKWQMTGTFSDPNFSKFPSGYAAFNVQNLNVNGTQTLFVTYANQSTSGGIIDEFSTNGTFIKTLISDTAGVHLNAPWGVAIAPQGWGQFGGDLLVGNNNAGPGGLTEINAYNLTTGAFAGTLTLNTGQPFSVTELWALSFGNGGGAGSEDTLFFTAGLDNNTNGLFGAISVPEPSSAVLGLIAMGVLTGGWRWKNRRRLARS